MKSDERILGDGNFVEKILSKSQEVWLPGKSRQQVAARSLLCFWAVRELGESMTSLAKCLNLSTAAVSKSVVRGAEIAENAGCELNQV